MQQGYRKLFRLFNTIQIFGILLTMVGFKGRLKAQTWTVDIPNAAIFSSPKAAQLNNTGLNDIVVATGNEFSANPNGVVAIEGIDGSIIWTFPSKDQLFSTPIFNDFNKDQNVDVLIAGRRAQFYCIDGKTGDLIWQVDSNAFGKTADSLRFNYYTPVVISDQNNDQVPDLINVYGGGSTASIPYRPAGFIVLVSGKDGQILASDTLPGGIESYMSPIEIYNNQRFLVGTGGERFGGGFYSIKLSDIYNGTVENTEPLFYDSLKGYIPPPSLADFNNDGGFDIVIPHLNEKVTLFDYDNDTILWEHYEPGFEHYTSPIIGQFTDDQTLDVFCSFQQGVWPFYTGYKWVLIDGSDGTAVWDSTISFYQLTQYVALDSDGDGYDEVIAIVNKDKGFTTIDYVHEVVQLNFNPVSATTITNETVGLNIFSSPLILTYGFGAKRADLVYCHTSDPDDYYTVDGSRISFYENLFPYATRLSWGGYLGNSTSGLYNPIIMPNVKEPIGKPKVNILYNRNLNRIIAPNEVINLKAFDALGRLIQEVNSNMLHIQPQSTFFVITAIFEDGSYYSQKFIK